MSVTKESAKIMLEHWIEHNESHSKAFRARAEQIREISEASALAVAEAADLMDQCTQRLRKAKDNL